MVIKTDGRFLGIGSFLRSPAQGPKTAPGGLHRGQDAGSAQHHKDPAPQTEPGLKQDRQQQKKQGRKNDGKAELPHPHQQGKKLHKFTKVKK